jgi:hypothetical protein
MTRPKEVLHLPPHCTCIANNRYYGFFSRKYSRGGPHCRDYIKQKQTLYKEASEERQKETPKKASPRQKDYTKASILGAFAHKIRVPED